MPLVALIAVTVVWGVTFVQVKDAVEVYPLFAFLAVRYAIAAGVLGVVAMPRVRALGPARRRSARGIARGRHRAPNRGPRADDGLEHRLHHRPLRRPDPALRARALPDARGSGGLARSRPLGDRAGDALGGACRVDDRRSARACLDFR